ncbi:MAG: DUF2059 domain-containing protein [Beijerinckiaceae bacterium]
MSFAKIAATPLRIALVAAALSLPHAASAQAPAPAAAPAAPAAAAPSDGHMKAATEFAGRIGLDLPISEILNEMRGQLVRTYTTTRPEIAKDLDTVLNGLVPEIAKQKDDILKAGSQIIAARFTEAELGELNTFFKSAIGQKYQKEQPQVFSEFLIRVQAWNQTMANTVITRVREEMKKKGHNL